MVETVRGMGQDIIGSWNGIGTLLCRLLDAQTGSWYPLLEERHRPFNERSNRLMALEPYQRATKR